MPLLALALTLMGISLDSPAAALRAKLGDPLFVERTSTLSRTADYLRSDDPSGVLKVTERNGVVFAVEIERERPEPTPGPVDSFGVALGMTREAVFAKRGKPAFETVNTMLYPQNANEDESVIYRFDGDIVEGIKIVASGTSAPGDPALPKIAEAAGDGYATAIVDVSPSVLVSDHFRERYLAVHSCDTTGRTSTVERRDGKSYVIVTATCLDKKRTLYFDVTRARP